MMRTNLLKIIIILGSVLGFGYLVYSLYTSKTPQKIITIYPEAGETKIRPTDSGGLIVPNSDSIIYETLKSSHVTRKITLLPEPEQPLNNFRNIKEDASDSIDAILEKINTKEKDLQEQLPGLPDKKLEAPSQFSEAFPEKNEKIANLSTPLNKSLNIVKVEGRTNKIENISHHHKPNFYKVQLASVKSEEEGRVEGERIKHKYSKTLSKSIISVKKVAHSKNRLFYSVLAGEYPSASEAKAICKKLSSLGQTCIVVR